MNLMTIWIAIGAVGIVCIGIGVLISGVASIILINQNKKTKIEIIESIDNVADEIYTLSDKIDALLIKKKKDKKNK